MYEITLPTKMELNDITTDVMQKLNKTPDADEQALEEDQKISEWEEDRFCSQCHEYCVGRFGQENVDRISSPVLVGYLMSVSDEDFSTYFNSTNEDHDCIACQIHLDEGDGRDEHYYTIVIHDSCLHPYMYRPCRECDFLLDPSNKRDCDVLDIMRTLT